MRSLGQSEKFREGMHTKKWAEDESLLEKRKLQTSWKG